MEEIKARRYHLLERHYEADLRTKEAKGNTLQRKEQQAHVIATRADKSFAEIKNRIAKKVKKKKAPALLHQETETLLSLAKKKGVVLKKATTKLTRVLEQQNLLSTEIQQKKAQLEKIQESQEELRLERSLTQEESEMEELVEIASARVLTEGSKHSEISEREFIHFQDTSHGNSSHGKRDEGEEGKGTGQQSEKKERASSFHTYQKRVSEIEKFKTAGGSRFRFQYQLASGKEVTVNLEKRGDGHIHILLQPHSVKERIQLWQERPQIEKALREAGMKLAEIRVGQ